jgi:transposase InsO family protein
MIAKTFKISRQGYYKLVSANKTNLHLKTQVLSFIRPHRKIMDRLGTRKLYDKIKPLLVANGIKLGRDALFKILREEHMLVRKRKNFTKTTHSYHRFMCHPNLVKDISIHQPEQVWVSDITYIRVDKEFYYLSLITDAYSKQIMGYQLADSLKAIHCENALKMALRNRKYPQRELVHHSDRGFQYCSDGYISLLKENNLSVSMTTKYDPYENAIAERVNGILKDEFGIGEPFPNEASARYEISKSIRVYNTYRPHLSCQMMTPNQAHINGKYELKRWNRKFSRRDISRLENKSLSLCK